MGKPALIKFFDTTQRPYWACVNILSDEEIKEIFIKRHGVQKFKRFEERRRMDNFRIVRFIAHEPRKDKENIIDSGTFRFFNVISPLKECVYDDIQLVKFLAREDLIFVDYGS
jgi:hypothetical protein